MKLRSPQSKRGGKKSRLDTSGLTKARFFTHKNNGRFKIKKPAGRKKKRGNDGNGERPEKGDPSSKREKVSVGEGIR